MFGALSGDEDVDLTGWVEDEGRQKRLRLEDPIVVRVDEGDGAQPIKIESLLIRRLKAGELDLLASKSAEREPLAAMRGLIRKIIVDPHNTILDKHLAEMDAADFLRAVKVVEGFLPLSRKTGGAA
jgi:hypothetical protein